MAEYDILEVSGINGTCFDVITKGFDGVTRTHTCDISDLKLDYNGNPKWLRYVDEFYNTLEENRKKHDMEQIKVYAGLKRDTAIDTFKKGSKQVKINHQEVVDKIKKGKA